MKLQKMINNKNVLYGVIILAVLCSLGFICISSYECLAILAITYIISSNYIKNKIVCLLLAIFVANFVFGCKHSFKGLLVESFVGYKGRPGSLDYFAETVGGEASNSVKKIVKEEIGKAVVNAKLEEGASTATAVKAGKIAADKAGKDSGDKIEEFVTNDIKEGLSNMFKMEKDRRKKK